MTDARMTARRVPGGYVLEGRKTFATNSAVATNFSTTARADEPDGPTLLLCQVAMDQPGVRVEQTWNTMGMRARCSDDVVFDGVHIADEAVVHRLPIGHLDRRVLETVWSWAMPAFGAVYTGIAIGALDWTVARLAGNGRRDDTAVQDVVGECRLLIEPARATIARHVREVERGELAGMEVRAALARCAMVKDVAATNAIAVLARLVDVHAAPRCRMTCRSNGCGATSRPAPSCRSRTHACGGWSVRTRSAPPSPRCRSDARPPRRDLRPTRL